MKLSLLGNIIDFLFPRYCAICDERLLGTEEMLCATCLQDLPITPTWEAPYENNMAKMFWGRIPIEKCAALFYYHSHSNPSYIIYKLKYHHRPDTGNYLGRLIASKGIESDFFKDIDAIIPIPITKSRRKTRGYNQSEEIARGIQERTPHYHRCHPTSNLHRKSNPKGQMATTGKRKACIPTIRYLSRQRRQTSHHRSCRQASAYRR